MCLVTCDAHTFDKAGLKISGAILTDNQLLYDKMLVYHFLLQKACGSGPEHWRGRKV